MAAECGSQTIDPVAALETEKLILKYNSFYRNAKTKITIYNLPFIILSWSINLLTWLPMAIEIIRKIHELDQIVEILYFFMSENSYQLKLINFHYNRQLLEPLEEILRSDIFRGSTAHQNKLIEDAIAKAKYMANVYRVICGCAIAFLFVLPFVDQNLEHPIPVPGWYPFNITKYRVAITCFQSFGILWSGLNNSCLDMIACSLMILGATEFEVLKDRLMRISPERKVGDEFVLKELKKCVKHHNEIIRYVALVEKMFTTVVLLQFIASALSICFTGFQLTVVPVKSTKCILLIAWFAAILTQIIMYCWFGHLIMVKSKEVMDCCYAVNWHKHGPNVRKVLFIIMERSKKPVVVTAGKMFTLSLGTLATILRSSYSYFAVLQSVYKKERKRA